MRLLEDETNSRIDASAKDEDQDEHHRDHQNQFPLPYIW